MVSKWPQNANTLWHQWGDSVKHMDMDSLWLLYRHSIWYSGAFYLRYNMGVKPPKASALKHLGMHMHHSYHKKTLAKKHSPHFFQCFPHLGQLWNNRVISIRLNPPPPPWGVSSAPWCSIGLLIHGTISLATADEVIRRLWNDLPSFSPHCSIKHVLNQCCEHWTGLLSNDPRREHQSFSRPWSSGPAGAVTHRPTEMVHLQEED